MRSDRLCPIRLVSIGAFATALVSSSAFAQSDTSVSDAKPPAKSPAKSPASPDANPGQPKGPNAERWRVRRVVEIGSEYDHNVYLLSDSKRPDLSSPSDGAIASGHYAGMPSASDVITNLSGGVEIKGPGAFGRDLEIRPELAYAAYTRNAERRHVTFGATVAQELGHGNRLRVLANATPSYFAKNYLADATDANGSGTIESAERRYRPGTYREHEIAVGYRHRLDRATKKSPFGAAVEVDAGYYGRAYKAPFAARDVGGPTAQAALDLDLTRRLELDLEYRFASLSGTPRSQVMLIDEVDAGRDLNDNGSSADANVRVQDLADYSRAEHSLGTRVRMNLTDRADLRLSAEHRWRTFGSEQPLDLANNGRRDARDELEAELSVKLASGLRLVTNGAHAVQRLERGGDAGVGEVDDYDRTRFSLGFRYNF